MKKYFVYVEENDEIRKMVFFSPTERALKDKLKRKKIDYIKIKECGMVKIARGRLEKALANLDGITKDEVEYIVEMCSSSDEQ